MVLRVRPTPTRFPTNILSTPVGTEEKKNRINLARSAFSRLQYCLWSGRVYQAVVRSILLYGCETWPVRVADERMLEAFDNDSILRVRRRDCVPFVELRHHLCLTSMPALLVQRRLRWFGHATRRPGGELIKDLLLPTPPRTWRRRVGRPDEYMGYHDQGRPETDLRTASLRPRTMEKGLVESV